MYDSLPYQGGYSMAFGATQSFGVSPQERKAANDFADEVRVAVISGTPLDQLAGNQSGQDNHQTKDDALASDSLPNKPAWMPQSVWGLLSDYVLRRRNAAYQEARAACGTELSGAQAKDCRDVVRDGKRNARALRANPQAKSASLWGPNKAARQAPVTQQDFADYRIVTGEASPASNTIRTLKGAGEVWLNMQQQAGALRQAFSLPMDAAFVPGYEGISASAILAGAPMNTPDVISEFDPMGLGTPEVARGGMPMWSMALLLLGGLGMLVMAGLRWLRP